MEKEFARLLIEWYHEHKRDLPWRNTNDPYLIWISEIILQQTRVAQGYAYYQRFIERFPNLESLAAAEENEVLKYWQGLGYYSRARNLHQAAISVNGVFPVKYEDILKLKGVGTYTAAAICSFAYNQPHAVVDGNVYRVLSRFFGINEPIDSGKGKKIFASLAHDLLDKIQPALYNQAIMDFGALQCTPLSPDCTVCPFKNRCFAFNHNMVSSLPIKQNKTKTSERFFYYLLIRDNGNIYLNKRTENDIWKNLYELPLIESNTALAVDDFIRKQEFASIFKENSVVNVRLLNKTKHVLSHRIIYADFYELEAQDIKMDFLSKYTRLNMADLELYPVSRLMHNFFENFL
ncbi:MAG: A/G-specific adenine glycosylase [Bacteroides graminisolvens]|jgi:A/G-specific adenine glycosylase|uniref:Adenine DNA glycosylase n=3 Tax=root TaxID=1 RepID=A0A069D186_9BACE|nr:A/G-specific adenine glycosylase [Bacteroides graminisolvens]MBP7293663.1 A/G-specific adenine glycosylase [Bacteroides sp.]MBP9552882.1 A/G-specific adenine glycosylase [Bacteroides sp.]MEA4885532.1 A/G-specific adenine glycosylase [Bacteroides graminisolvens]GAK36197.1 A/G-specific adenine glycosylase [Bacteroides graminisolvens DSM 19988 = JCM 15093]